MSKAAKARKHAKKMQQKHAEKAAKRAKYAALRGTSKKNKIIIRAAKSHCSSIYKHAHIMRDCGNVGCKRCYPLTNKR